MDHTFARTKRRSRRERSLLAGVVRLLVLSVLIGALALGALGLAPSAVDEVPAPSFDDGFSIPGERSPGEEPPPAGDRQPDAAHPADPNESSYETAVENVSSEAVEDAVHAEVNDRRVERGLEPIDRDATIASVARAHSHDMAEREYFSHTNPEGEGPFDRFTAVADYCRVYGENLALNRLDAPVREPGGDDVAEYRTTAAIAEALVEQWMHSPDHREAILDDGWDRGGVGVHVTEDGAVYATHNFCTVR